MAGQVVGTIVGEVRADTTRFLSDVETAFKRAASTNLTLTAALDDTRVKAALGTLLKSQSIQIETVLDGKRTKTDLDDLTKSRDAQIDAILDPGKAGAELDDLSKDRTAQIEALLDSVGANANIGDLIKARDVSITAVANIGRAAADVDTLIKSDTKNIEVNLDAGRALAEIGELTKTESKTIEVITDSSNFDARTKQQAAPSSSSKTGGIGKAGLGAVAAGGATAAGAVGLVLGLKEIIDTGGNYQVALAKIAAQTGATKDQISAVDKVTQALGRDQELGAVSAGDAAEAIQVLTKGQFSLSEATDSARAALQYSIVSQQGSRQSAEQLTTAMANLQIPVKNTQQVVDALSASDLRGVTGTAQDYAEALKEAGGAYSTAFHEQAPIDRLYNLNTALVTLDNQAGITGGNAGSILKRFLTDLQGPTKVAQVGIGQLSVAFMHAGGDIKDGADLFHNAKGQLLEVPQLIDNISLALKGKDDLEKAQLLEPIFTTYGKQGLAFLTQGRANWDKYKAGVQEVGITQKLTAAQATGLKGATAALGGSLETLAIQSAKAITPALVPALDALSSGLNALPGLASAASSAIGGLFDEGLGKKAKDSVAGFFGFAKTAIGEFQTQSKKGKEFGDDAKHFGNTDTSAQAPKIDTGTSAVISRTLDKLQEKAPIIKTLRDDFSAVSDAIGIAVDAISKFGNYLGTALKPAIDAAKGAFDSFKTAASAVGDLLSDIAKRIDFSKVLDGIKTVFRGVVEYVTGQIQSLAGIFDLIKDILTGKWSAIWDDLKKIFSGAWSSLKGVVTAAFGELSAVFEVLRATVTELAGRAWKGIQDAWDKIKPAIVDAVKALPGDIVAGLGNLVDVGSKILGGIVDGISAAAPKVGDAILTAIRAIPGLLVNVAGVIGDVGGKIIGAIGDGIVSGAKVLGPKVLDAIRAIPGVLGDIASAVAGIGGKIITAIGDAIATGGKSLGPKVLAAIVALPGGIIIGAAVLAGIGVKIIAAIGDAIVTAGKNLGPKILGVITALPKTIGDVSGKVLSIGAAIIAGVANAITSNGPKVLSALAKIVANLAIAAAKAAITIPITIAVKVIGSIPGVGAIKDAANTAVSAAKAAVSAPSNALKKVTSNLRIGGHAAGGPVSAKNPIIVGELGPEIFIPTEGGKIFSNTDSKRIIEAATKKAFQFAGQFTRLPSFASGIAGTLKAPSSGNAQNQNAATEALDKLATATNGVVKDFGNLTDGVVDSTSSFGDATAGLSDFSDSVSTVGTDAVSAISDNLSSANLADPITDSLSDAIDQATIPVVDAQNEAANTISNTVDDSMNKVGDTVQALAKKADDSSSDLSDALEEAGDSTKNWADDLNNQTNPGIQDLMDQISDLQDKVQDLQTRLDAVTTKAMQGNIDDAGTKASEFGITLSDSGKAVANSLGTSAESVSGSFNRFTSDAVDPAHTALSGFASDGISRAHDMLNRFTTDGVAPAAERSNFFARTLNQAGVDISVSINGAAGTINAAAAAIAAQVGAAAAAAAAGAAAAAAAADAASRAGASDAAAQAAAAAAASAFQIPLIPLALGGPITARNPYLVGEEGPELFFPTESGRIITAQQTRELLTAANVSLQHPTGDDSDLINEIKGLREQFADIADKVDRPPVQIMTPVPEAQIDYLVRRIRDELDKSYG